LLAWLAGDRAKGDPADAPLPRDFGKDGWLIGKPGVVYQLPRPVAIKATGTMPYQNLTVETDLKEDRWVQVPDSSRSVATAWRYTARRSDPCPGPVCRASGGSGRHCVLAEKRFVRHGKPHGWKEEPSGEPKGLPQQPRDKYSRGCCNFYKTSLLCEEKEAKRIVVNSYRSYPYGQVGARGFEPPTS
jgi:hypothetical protein